MSIAFVTFLGAFFTIVINVLGGARSIDISYLRAAQSMGASQLDLFWKIVYRVLCRQSSRVLQLE